MKRFDRYLFFTLFISTLVSLIFLLGIDFLVQSSDEVENIGNGQYTFWVMSYTLFLDIPKKIIEFLPASILVGSIMGLGQIGAQNELTVVRSAGVSKLRLSLSPIVLALLLGTGLIAIGEYISPKLSSKSELIRNQALGRPSDNTYAQGAWLKDQNHNIVHIDHFNQDGSIGGFSLYQNEDNGEVRIKQAVQGNYQQNHWQLSAPQTLSFKPEKVALNPSSPFWHNAVTPATLLSFADTKKANTISELYTITCFLKANNLNDSNESLRLWQKILLPFSTLTMLLIALPFVYNQQRGGASGGRLVIGILLGVSYYTLQGILSNLALLFHWTPLLGASLPILILGIPPAIMLLHH